MYKVTGFTNTRFYVTTYRKQKEATVVSNSSTSSQEPVDDDVTRNTFFVEESEKESPETITPEASTTLASHTEFRLDQSFYTSSDSDNEKGAVTDHNHLEVLQFIDTPIEDIPTVSFDTNFDIVTTNEVLEDIFNISQDSSPALIILHRDNLLEELIEQFTPLSKLQSEIYLSNGELEKAADIGVFRDVLSEFWDEFMNKLTMGTHARIPFLRHDYDGRKWMAVAKILAKGLLEENYLPVQLSKSFIECCIFGENKSNTIEDFSKYISTMDSEIIAGAMQNFHEVDYSELLECLDSLDCKWQPKQDNIGKLIKDLAHKEIIQKPMFIISHWRLVLGNIIPFQQLEEIYENQKNFAKNVLRILDFDENIKEDEKKMAGYLKKFIREGDDKLTNHQLQAYKSICAAGNVCVCLDSTGSVVRKLKEPSFRIPRHIFLHAIAVNTTSGQFTVAHMLSEMSHTVALETWIKMWFRSGAPIPNQCVTDDSRALLNAVVRSFTALPSIEDYADALKDHEQIKVYIRIDDEESFLELCSTTDEEYKKTQLEEQEINDVEASKNKITSNLWTKWAESLNNSMNISIKEQGDRENAHFVAEQKLA
ncbi:unnamed protein product [Phaedon cochleariae]|uniref:Uncharacterized protein n=1 Tax=Phaedon cochleariae TaxID=80249 RepID=A0A9P0DEG6_PHACE|nr:unnamed protein product [Phaedon cochleariae]